MKYNSRFIVVKHDAKKARLHYDLRFVMPKSKIWMSFAVRKGVPEKPGVKVLAVRTHDHDEKEALFLGTIKDGYGAGKLAKFDDGKCIIHKYKPSHIIIEFKGRKIKGIYHLINTGIFNKKDYKKQQYMLFKGNALSEWSGMITRIPGLWADEVETSAAYYEGPKLPWSKHRTSVKAGKQIQELAGAGGAKYRKTTIEDEEKSEKGGEKLKWNIAKPNRVIAAEQIYNMLKNYMES